MSLSTNAELLAPLLQNRLFYSRERVNSHTHVSEELADHILRWRSGAPDVTMFKGELRQLSLYLLRYGAEVEVTPQPFEGFSLVHMSLRGGVEVESDGNRFVIAQGRAGVITPRRNMRLRWYPGADQLILKVPHTLMRQVGADCGLDSEGRVARLSSGFLLDRNQGGQWHTLVHSLLNVMSMPADSSLSRIWQDDFERNLALFLVAHQSMPEDQVGANRRDAKEALLGGGDSRRMNAVVEYMDARLGAPLSLEDMAGAAGVSVRTLNEMCRRHHGMTPMELLRTMRLDAVRARLLAQPDASITETALSLGFGHPGRFSAYYSDRFGELPRQTQARGG